MIDLRSDTVTRPSAEMLAAMTAAPVGDDVFREDPSVNRLEERVAALFGMETGLFVPSGTMGNQLALHIQAGPGDEIILDRLSHIFNYEAGSAGLLSSVQLNPLAGQSGKITPELVSTAVRGRNDWDPFSRVLALENTTNKGGGAFYSKEELFALREIANQHNLALHIDGARIWNAITASGIEPEFFGRIADTISVCFSKGLGAPVGSMLLCSAAHAGKARRARKMWGGGMRQVGLLAAAADFAIDHVWPLLADDHRRAASFAQWLQTSSVFRINPDSVFTNIVLFDVPEGQTEAVLETFRNGGIGLTAFGPQTLRAVFHYQVTDADMHHIAAVIEGSFGCRIAL